MLDAAELPATTIAPKLFTADWIKTFEIEKIENLKDKGRDDHILYLASLGEQYSLHPLAKSIVKYNNLRLEEAQNVKEVAGEGGWCCP